MTFGPRVWSVKDPNRPKDAVYVGRPSKWGNPYTHLKSSTYALYQVHTAEAAVIAFWEYLKTQPGLVADAKVELQGKDLVCWGCRPCHGDVWLRIANEEDDANNSV